MQSDERGLSLTTESAEAAAAFDRTIRDNLEYRLGTAKSLKEMLAADPDFVMGQVLKGYLLSLFGSNAYDAAARDCLAFCQAETGRVTPREAAHVAALETLIGGDLRKSTLIWDAVLVEAPQDASIVHTYWFAWSAFHRGTEVYHH